MSFGVFLLIIGLVGSVADDQSSMLHDLNPKEFEEALIDGPIFAKFYAPWCGHCKALRPTWETLSAEPHHGVRFVAVDCTKHSEFCTNREVKGYPTLKLFTTNIEGKSYTGQRTEEALLEYARQNAYESCSSHNLGACDNEKERGYANKWSSATRHDILDERDRLKRMISSSSVKTMDWIVRRAQILGGVAS